MPYWKKVLRNIAICFVLAFCIWGCVSFLKQRKREHDKVQQTAKETETTLIKSGQVFDTYMVVFRGDTSYFGIKK